MKSRSSHLLFFIVVLALLLSACSAGNPASKTPLRVEYTSWWSDVTILVAKEKGLFDKYGVNVEPVYYENFPQIFTDLPEHKIDGGLLAIGDALVASQTVDLKVVGAYDDGGNNTVVALPEITSVADLKGKNIGVPLGTSYELFVVHMLESAGLTQSDVQLVNTDPTEVSTNLTNSGIVAGYVWSPDMAPGSHVIFQKSDAPGLFPDVIVFRAEVVKERPEDIRAFLKAWFEAVEYRQTHVEETRQIVSKYTGIPLDQILGADTGVQIFTLSDNENLFQAEASGGTFSVVQAAKLNADFQTKAGSVTKPIDLNVLIDGSFLK